MSHNNRHLVYRYVTATEKKQPTINKCLLQTHTVKSVNVQFKDKTHFTVYSLLGKCCLITTNGVLNTVCNVRQAVIILRKKLHPAITMQSSTKTTSHRKKIRQTISQDREDRKRKHINLAQNVILVFTSCH